MLQIAWFFQLIITGFGLLLFLVSLTSVYVAIYGLFGAINASPSALKLFAIFNMFKTATVFSFIFIFLVFIVDSGNDFAAYFTADWGSLVGFGIILVINLSEIMVVWSYYRELTRVLKSELSSLMSKV